MMKFAATLLIFLFVTATQLAHAQSTPPQSNAEGPAILEQAEKELIEIFSEVAVDFKSKKQTAAVITLSSYFGTRDAKFNEPTLKVMSDFSSGDSNSRLIERALSLMSLTTLTDEQKVAAMLDCFVHAKKEFKGLSRRDTEYAALSSAIRRLTESLRKFSDECKKQSFVRIKQSDQYSLDLLPFLKTVNEQSPEVLAIVMKTARSEDVERAEVAMMFAAQLVRDMKRARAVQLAVAKAPADGDTKLPPSNRYLQYAKRIIARADKNKDGVLSGVEFDGMLMSPAPSDTNGDGIVTVQEYAVWMEKRSKK
ncbi:MAG: hypothetical protein AAFU85_03415 [Planctomycetota bacterium]